MANPYIVDKSNEVLTLNVSHPKVDKIITFYQHCAIICSFNRFWHHLVDLYQWIFKDWSNLCEDHFCLKGFFIVQLPNKEDLSKVY